MTVIRNLTFIFTLAFLFLDGCSLFKKKDIEESEDYKKMMQYNDQGEKQFDSLNRSSYQKMLDSSNKEMKKQLDSLTHNADSIRKSIEERIDKQNKQNK